ncbi:MAG: hypothetical protein C5B50_23375 [Verrucomicrobia bacterium]|nr:MAG: hypothetical protein C5B50_23375 [Verrucomicrobiota bacterium]
MSLRQVVTRLYALGVSRQQLVEWAVAAGFSESFTRSLLSKLFCNSGQRSRKKGAGRKIPKEALALLALARNSFGGKAPKYLLAVYRAAKSLPDPVDLTSYSLPPVVGLVPNVSHNSGKTAHQLPTLPASCTRSFSTQA